MLDDIPQSCSEYRHFFKILFPKASRLLLDVCMIKSDSVGKNLIPTAAWSKNAKHDAILTQVPNTSQKVGNKKLKTKGEEGV